MYMDDGDEHSLADSLRYELPKEVSDFFGGIKKQDAHRFSSTVGWRILKMYPGAEAFDDDVSDLQEELAHAAKVPCDELTPRHKVLCVHMNERGHLEYGYHHVGKCPIILALLKKRKQEGDDK